MHKAPHPRSRHISPQLGPLGTSSNAREQHPRTQFLKTQTDQRRNIEPTRGVIPLRLLRTPFKHSPSPLQSASATDNQKPRSGGTAGGPRSAATTKKKKSGGGQGNTRRRVKAIRVGSTKGCRVTNEILVPFCLQYCRGCIRENRGARGAPANEEEDRSGAPYPDISTAPSETPCELSARRVMRTRAARNYFSYPSLSPPRPLRPLFQSRGGEGPPIGLIPPANRGTGLNCEFRRVPHTDKGGARERE